MLSTNIIEIMQYINTPYKSREYALLGRELYYTTDYKRIFARDDNTYIEGITNNKYRDMAPPAQPFKMKPQKKPSESIRAIMQGVTITECAAAVQIVFYVYMLNKYGDAKFDAVFGNPLATLIITNNLFAPLFPSDKGKHLVGNPLFFCFDIVKLVKHVFETKRALLITSNEDILFLYESIPYHIGYWDKVLNNFIVIKNEISSFRIPWIENCVGKLHEFANYRGDSSIGV